MKEVPKKDEPAVSGGVAPPRLPGGGFPIPEPLPYPQMPTIPCFPDPPGSNEK